MCSMIAKPFLRWAGGKRSLLPHIEAALPESFKTKRHLTYVEPFIGGGAVFFHLLQQYPNIKQAIINDLNGELVLTYRTIRDCPQLLIERLEELEALYNQLPTMTAKQELYIALRNEFNKGKMNDEY